MGLPLGEAVMEASSTKPMPAKLSDGLKGEQTVRSSAISDDFPALGKACQSAGELFKRDT